METLKPELFVPDSPTLYPGMLLRKRGRPAYPPFDSDSAHWFYFARNAVWTAVKMLGLNGGEVLVPSYHHGVEIEALVHAGATPVFYRVGGRWDVDLEDVASKIGPRTRALYLTHYAGFPGPLEQMKRLAEQHGLPLLEDCALSLLSCDGSLRLGTVGEVGIFCLYKTLPVPNGGALVINGERRYSLPSLPPPPGASVFNHTASALLRNFEMRGGKVGRWGRAALRAVAHKAVRAGQIERVPVGTMHFDPGHLDLGMSPLSLRIAWAQEMERVVEVRRRNYFYLLGRLRDLCPPLFSELPAGVCPLFYPLVVEDKPEVLARLRAAGIEAVDFWRDYHPACDPNAFPETTALRASVVEIPCHQDMEAETMTQVAQVVRTILLERRRRDSRQARG